MEPKKRYADTTFFRIAMDGSEIPMSIDGLYLGPRPTPCFIVGGAPSLKDMPLLELNSLAIPKIVINNAATLVTPTHWVAFDSSNKMLSWVYKSPAILKFQPSSRWNNLINGTKSLKACENGGMLYYRNASGVGFHDWFDPNRRKISTWSFSLSEAIQIALYLGFRRLYMIGVSMTMDTSEGGERYAWREESGPKVACQKASRFEVISQQLRQCRVNLASYGVSIISCTPGSVLGDFDEGSPYDVFRTMDIHDALDELEKEIGQEESPDNLYHVKPGERKIPTKNEIRDYPPQGWQQLRPPPQPNGKPKIDVQQAPMPPQPLDHRIPHDAVNIAEHELEQARLQGLAVARMQENFPGYRNAQPAVPPMWEPEEAIMAPDIEAIDFGRAVET